MRALTVRQPWAWLIVNGHKDVENRARAYSYRGRFAVHAGLARDDDADARARRAAAKRGIIIPPSEELVRGALVGDVELYDALACEGGRPVFPGVPRCPVCARTPWAIAGQAHHLLRDALPYANPPRMSGSITWFEIPGLDDPRLRRKFVGA